MQIADVIVDVPTMQTNRPYTYLIPEQFQNDLEPGMRVSVPFGNGNRLIQGFITKIDYVKNNDINLEKYKEIQEILDIEPTVNEELLQLADWMAKYTFAFKIKCLQVMLPSALKAKYDRIFKFIGNDKTSAIQEIFGNDNELVESKHDLTPQKIQQLLNLRKKNLVEVSYIVKDKLTSKKVWAFRPILEKDSYQELSRKVSKNANRQKLLLELLQRLDSTKEYRQLEYANKLNLSSVDFKNAETKGWISRFKVDEYRDPFANIEIKRDEHKILSKEQDEAFKSISRDVNNHVNSVNLLQGVTGSGKTEVYLQVIDNVLKKGQTAIMLVPEISLTPQMINRFKARFGSNVATLHSGLSNGEKLDEWRRIEKNEAKVVVGARSAIFAPLKNIGVIIIDEEHEDSYKQEEMPRYDAKDVAIWRGKYHHCPVVLGSATPSLETRARAQKGVYKWLKLTKRINGKSLPKVHIIDMKEAYKDSPSPDFSIELLNEIYQTIQRKEQVVLMLNRRGYSSFVMCRDCGNVVNCPNCDISLTLHMDSRTLRCHYCGFEMSPPKVCSVCKSTKIRYYGTGTQKVEAELKKLIPNARILRMDVDTTRKKGAHQKILDEFGSQKADILLGTQMIAKGLDFPNITLVGVLNADTGLNFPDFRASEKTFQLLTQVSGRAGRADKDGNVFIQTFNPDHYAINLARKHSYEEFFYHEMKMRHMLNYPPYYYSYKISVSAKNEEQVVKRIYKIGNELKGILSAQAQILGPAPQGITRINNRYYYQIIIKYKKEEKLEEYLSKLLVSSQKFERNGELIVIDRNPNRFE
ncbi:primosomal protein N' [Ligilactobacillus hayakitensis]|nr:primosomal protein N' [Ligilactobacillus hayakitensis]